MEDAERRTRRKKTKGTRSHTKTRRREFDLQAAGLLIAHGVSSASTVLLLVDSGSGALFTHDEGSVRSSSGCRVTRGRVRM